MRPIGLLVWFVFPLEAFAAGNTLMCEGRVTQATRDVGQSAIEFTLEYAEGMQVATFKSNYEAINGPLLFTLDEAFLHARQSQPKALGAARSIGVQDLRVSRNTGQFTLAVALFRDIDLPDGGAQWEGLCRRRDLADRKF